MVCGGAENTLRIAGGMSDALLYDFMDAPTNIFQKIRRTLLGPIEILSRRDEADVPAPRGHFQRHGRIRFRNAVRIAIRRKERVVRGIDQQKGHINMLQKPQAAAFPPIMACGIEAVQRGGIAIVEFAERTDAVEPVDIDAIGEAGMFFFDLPPQRPQEIGHVRSPGGQRKATAAVTCEGIVRSRSPRYLSV